jgi:hypothetical protein
LALFLFKNRAFAHSQVLHLWRIVAVIILYKIIDTEAELLSEDEVILAKEKVFKRSFAFGIEIVFDNVVTMHFCD